MELSKLVSDIREITQRYRSEAAIQLNATIINERWEIGKRIVKEELRAEIETQKHLFLLQRGDVNQ